MTYWHSLDKIKMRRPFGIFYFLQDDDFVKIVDKQRYNIQKERSYEVAVSAVQPKNSEPLCDLLALIG